MEKRESMSESEIEEWLPVELSNSLTRAERIILMGVKKEFEFNFKTGDEIADKLENDNLWGSSRELRSTFLRWFLKNKNIEPLLTQKGIKIIGAKITGILDFEALVLSFPIEIVDCALREGINLKSSKIESIKIIQSITGGIYGQNLKCNRDLEIINSVVNGGLHLLNATIKGALHCFGSNLNNPGGNSLTGQVLSFIKI